MKPRTIACPFIVLFYLLNNLEAQSWCTIHTGRESLFSGDDTFKSIRIDSVKYINDTALYFNFTTIRYSDMECFKLGKPAWLGKYILVAPNGDNLFFNKNNDTIRIKTLAGADAEWVSYTLPDGKYIQSTVLSIEYASFLGLTDSVKTIAFQLKDLNGNNLNHPINNAYLKIGKQYGFVHAVNFYLFPDLYEPNPPDYYFNEYQLAGITNPHAGYQNLKWSEVNDFNVGDEMHSYLYIFDSPPQYEIKEKKIIKIIDKQEYAGGDSMMYTFENCWQQTYISSSTSSVFYGNDSNVEIIYANNPIFDVLGDEPAINDNNLIQFAGNFIYGGEIRAKAMPFNFSYILTDSCASPLIPDEDLNYYYLEGLGGPYWPDGDWGNVINYCELVYYKKGEVEWGTPYNCDSLLTGYSGNPTASDDVEVFPNPAGDYFTIQMNGANLPARLILTDIFGNVLISREIDQTSGQVKCTAIQPGLYFFQITNRKNFMTSGKIVIK